jgi:hypothetical protein
MDRPLAYQSAHCPSVYLGRSRDRSAGHDLVPFRFHKGASLKKEENTECLMEKGGGLRAPFPLECSLIDRPPDRLYNIC